MIDPNLIFPRLKDEGSEELRIVPQELWEVAKAKQKDLDHKKPGLWQRKRPQYLLSGIAKYGVCGGGYAKIKSTHYGCSTSKNKGESVCANRNTIKRETLEKTVLATLQTHLMRDDLIKVFCEEYTRHMNDLCAEQNGALKPYKTEKAKLSKERENVLKAIREGISASLVKERPGWRSGGYFERCRQEIGRETRTAP